MITLLRKQLKKIQMKVYICLLLAISPIFAANWPFPTDNCSYTTNSFYVSSATHYGGCIWKTKVGTPQTNLRSVDATVSSGSSKTCVANAAKYQMVYGLLMAGQFSCDTTLHENFFKWVAKATTEMLTPESGTGACDGYHQCLVMQKMYEYRAATMMTITESPTCATNILANWSACDMIMQNQSSTNSQINEVMEHIVHAITDVGMYRAMPNIFGFETGTLLHAAFTESVTNGLNDDSSYNTPQFMANAEGHVRIKIQEYIYMLWGSCSGFFKAYGNAQASEWKDPELSCEGTVKTKNPKGAYLYKHVISKILKMPSTATLTALGTFKSGGTPAAAPTLTDGVSNDTVCKCTCTAGCCNDTPFGDAAMYGKCTQPTGITASSELTCPTVASSSSSPSSCPSSNSNSSSSSSSTSSSSSSSSSSSTSSSTSTSTTSTSSKTHCKKDKYCSTCNTTSGACTACPGSAIVKSTNGVVLTNGTCAAMTTANKPTVGAAHVEAYYGATRATTSFSCTNQYLFGCKTGYYAYIDETNTALTGCYATGTLSAAPLSSISGTPTTTNVKYVIGCNTASSKYWSVKGCLSGKVSDTAANMTKNCNGTSTITNCASGSWSNGSQICVACNTGYVVNSTGSACIASSTVKALANCQAANADGTTCSTCIYDAYFNGSGVCTKSAFLRIISGFALALITYVVS